MNANIKKPVSNWQKIDDLTSTLSLSNHKWNEWEEEFIENIGLKLEHEEIFLSEKQQEIVDQLWEKI